MRFDFIIIGGGMVGAALACSLRASDRNVALIDALPPNHSSDHRLIGLTYASYCLFQNLKLWPALESNATKINQVHVSQQGKFGTVRLDATELKLPVLGYTVPAKCINQTLNENLSGITVFRPAKLTELTQNTNEATLTIETPEGKKTLTGSIVIGADGSYSTVRELLNIPFKKIDYNQRALVTITSLRRSHQNIAYERFLKQGAIAMLPLVGDRVATIWSGHTDFITHLMQLNDEDFLQQLQKQFGYRLGRFTLIEKRYSYPLIFIKAEQPHHQRVILIGNAAHTLHPIAAQGLNLSLYEVAQLTDYFTQHSVDNVSLNDFSTQQQQFSTQLSHNLAWLFSKDFFMINAARQLGMLTLDSCQFLKERFAWQAVGLSGRASSLLREKELHEYKV